MQVKLEDGTVVELPAGFNSIQEFVSKFSEAQQQLQALPDMQKKLEAYTTKVGDLDTLETRLQNLVQQKQEEARQAALAEGKTAKQAERAAQAAGEDIYEHFDELPARQRVEFLTNQLSSTLQQKLDQMVAEKWQQAQNALAQSQGMTQQQFDLLAKAIDLKYATPDLDLKKIWGEMTELAKATPDKLMEIALRNVTQPQMTEARIKDERAKWEEERKKADEAEKLKVLNSDSVPQWLKPREERASLNKPGGEEDMKRQILSNALQKGEITANQI